MHRKLFLSSSLIITAFINSAIAQEQINDQKWKFIVPLQTTRTEVAKSLGKAVETTEKNRFSETYKIDGYKLVINYAYGCSAREKSDYKVKPDTVARFIVYLDSPLPSKNVVYPVGDFEKGIVPVSDQGFLVLILYNPKREEIEKFSCTQ